MRVLLSWVDEALDRLAAAPCGYHADAPAAAEPTALAALALLGAGRSSDAAKHLTWLASQQSSSGSISPFSEVTQSAWPTPLAILAATVAARPEFNANDSRSTDPIKISQASKWLLSAEGKTIENSPDFGHDGLLVGWPWVLGTHSWQEPTAWSVLALKCLGLNDHPRCREGIQLLVNRLLVGGGCNYGNTVVLGQTLRPQVEPTGVTLLALAGEGIFDQRVELSLQYLVDSLSSETTPISLSYGLLGLTAHHRPPADAAIWLESAYGRTIKRDAAPLALALLALAAQGQDCPLIKYTKAVK